jgi:hypothetical protein
MFRALRSRQVRYLALGLLALAAPPAQAQEKAAVPAGGTVNVTIAAAGATPPPVSLTLLGRHGHVTPEKGHCTHTGGGLIDIASPSPDAVLITMTGAVVANASMQFDLEQCFEVNFDDPKVKKAKLTVEGRVIGLLRGEKKGCAEYRDACAHVAAGEAEILAVCVPPHQVCDHDNLSVNDHDGPASVPALPGKYTLHQTFTIRANSSCVLCKRPSAEFAPDPALDPLWISYHEPFHGVNKGSFGFQVLVKVAADTDEGNGAKKPPEALPPPAPAKP